MTTKGGRSPTDRPSGCCPKSEHRWKLWPPVKYCDMSRTQVVLLVVSFLLAKATHIQGSKVVYGSRGQKPLSCNVEPPEDINNNAVAFPGGDPEEETTEEVDTSQPVSTTGQRVAGHLLAVLLLASVAAAIVEAVRARMAQGKSSPKANDATTTSDTHHSSSSHGVTGRTPRRVPLQEKSHSQEIQLPRARSSSAGVTSHQEGTAAAVAAALATSRAQKALRARLLGGRPLALGGRAGGTPPLLRRSSFPVMSRTGSTAGRDANSGSPGMMSRKPSINDLGEDDVGDLQKRRVRIIRRF